MIFKSGIVFGGLGNDNFKFKNLKIKQVPFLRTEKFTNSFFNGFDGIVGLSPPGLAKNNIPSVLEMIK